MSRMFMKLLDEVRTMTYEKVDNNPDDYRFVEEDPDDVKTKLKYVKMHEKKATEFNQPKEVLDCVSHRALAHYKLGNYAEFEELTRQQLESSIELKDEMRQRQALSNLGVIFKMNHKLAQALEYYEEALVLAKKRSEKWCQGRIYNNMANIYEITGRYEKAIEYQQFRLEIATELKDLDGIGKSNSCMAGLHHTLGDLEKAVECYEKVQEVLRKKLKNFDTLADDAAGSDDDFVDIGGDEEEGEEEGEEGGGHGKGKKKKCIIL